MKKKLLLIALSLLLGMQSFAQEATFNHLEGSVVIDGIANDAVWSDAHITEIIPDKNFVDEVPSISDVSVKAFWNDTAIYVMISATDNVWAPSWVTGGNAWQADMMEIYFDVNEVLEDGIGAGSGAPDWLTYNQGHHQYAPDWSETDPGVAAEFNGATWAGTYDGTDNGTFTAEYKVPFEALLDNTGTALDPYTRSIIGFDICIIDNDDGADDPTNRQRLVWSNDGTLGENFNNMDEAGTVTLDPTSYVSVVPGTLDKQSVYPTIAHDYIHLPDNTDMLEIFNTLGQRVLIVNTPGNQLDVSTLQAGLHFVRITKESEKRTVKFFKE